MENSKTLSRAEAFLYLVGAGKFDTPEARGRVEKLRKTYSDEDIIQWSESLSSQERGQFFGEVEAQTVRGIAQTLETVMGRKWYGGNGRSYRETLVQEVMEYLREDSQERDFMRYMDERMIPVNDLGFTIPSTFKGMKRLIKV